MQTPNDGCAPSEEAERGRFAHSSDDVSSSDCIWSAVTHFLVQSDKLTTFQGPIGTSVRIKYTSIAVCKQFVALGTNTGAVHIFNREGYSYRLPICNDNRNGSVFHLAFCPCNSDILAYATSSGIVYVTQLNIDKAGARPETLLMTEYHKGSPITAVCWSTRGKSLYVGDEQGIVTRVYFSQSKLSAFGSSTEFLFKLNSPVVQIDSFDDLVLVSSLTSSHLAFNARFASGKPLPQVHKDWYEIEYFKINSFLSAWQPTENKVTCGQINFRVEGTSSASDVLCVSMPCSLEPKCIATIYCARPGSRLWEVDLKGSVVSTHQLKLLLETTPPLDLVLLQDAESPIQFDASAIKSHSVAFQKLILFNKKFLLTYSDEGLYVINPPEADIVLWTSKITGVVQLGCYLNHIYVLFADGSVRKLSMVSSSKLWALSYRQQQWLRCEWLLRNVKSCSLDKSAIVKLAGRLQSAGYPDQAEIVSSIARLQPDETESTGDRLSVSSGQSFRKLSSGIYARIDSESTVNSDEEFSTTADDDDDENSSISSNGNSFDFPLRSPDVEGPHHRHQLRQQQLTEAAGVVGFVRDALSTIRSGLSLTVNIGSKAAVTGVAPGDVAVSGSTNLERSASTPCYVEIPQSVSSSVTTGDVDLEAVTAEDFSG